MIIAISGSVGSGKTLISSKLGEKLGFKVVPLNEIAKNFKLNDIKSLQTFDFDLDKLLDFVEIEIENYIKLKENVIFEGHFAHFINPKFVDVLFIINRDLGDLKQEYIKRGYNEQKIKDNLEVESFNLCFYEAIENGYGGEVNDISDLMKGEDNLGINSVVYSIDNDKTEIDLLEKINSKLKNLQLMK